MKNIYYYIALVAILVSTSMPAKAQHIDLTGGQVLDMGYCTSTKMKQTHCAVVLFKGKTYNVLFDQKGELEIFLIEGDKATFIWSRNST